LRIIGIVIVGLTLRAISRRFINRLTSSVSEGAVPKVLAPLKERVYSSGILENSALLSERRRQRAATIGSVLNSVVSFTLLCLCVLLILDAISINLAPFIAGTSIIGVAIGFGAQNIIKDFLAGLFMILEDQYGVGDVIDFEKATGTVEAVGLRTTQLRDIHGTVWYVRNGEVGRVGNQSQGFAEVVLDLAVAAETDVEQASRVIAECAIGMYADAHWHELFVGEPRVIGVEAFSLDRTVIRLTAKVKPLEQWRIAREMRKRMKEALDAADISVAPELP